MERIDPHENGQPPGLLSGPDSDEGQDVLASINAAYQEVTRRDTSVEREKWHWKLAAGSMCGCALAFAGLALYLFLIRSEVAPYVQLVQVSDEGRVQPLGVPAHLLEYEPQDSQWLDMLGEWVRRVRWRGMDTVQARADWKWVYLHTCGAARRVLQHYEEVQKPFEPTQTLRVVTLKSITKNPSPVSYQALWEEMTTEAHAQPVVKRWTGTFTVGRLKPSTQEAMLMNRLGLCVSGFDLSQQP